MRRGGGARFDTAITNTEINNLTDTASRGMTFTVHFIGKLIKRTILPTNFSLSGSLLNCLSVWTLAP